MILRAALRRALVRALLSAAAGALLTVFAPGARTADPPDLHALWAALERGGVTVLLRHAAAPGFSDPPGFRVEDCATQRNLSEQGRAQARAIGAALRQRGVTVSRVRSSQWCRCLETARLLDAGPVEPWPMLNSLHGRREREAEQTAALRAAVSGPPARGVVVLVTHQANIRALTGAGAGSGEMVVVQPLGAGAFRVLGSLPTR
jgi:phosphohistidine phosphatase SixA